jgi:phosphatidylglycerophosphate synthase
MRLTHIPFALVLFRASLIPLLPILAYVYGETAVPSIMIAIILGFLSDIFDGIIARRLQCDTDLLRRLDSQTDALFWCAILLTIGVIHPSWVIAQSYTISALLGMELTCYLVSYLKFRRETCTHSYLSKFWGVSLCIAFLLVLIGQNLADSAWQLCVAIGVFSQLEVIAILCVLPRWQRDIPSVFHAWTIRKALMNVEAKE